MFAKFNVARKLPARWVFWWIVMPNLALMAMWFVGGPRLSLPIMIAGVAALLFGSVQSRIVRVVGMVGIYALLLISYFSRVFYLTLDKAFTSLIYLSEMNLSISSARSRKTQARLLADVEWPPARRGQRQIAVALHCELNTTGFAHTDIMIVGDHIPPLSKARSGPGSRQESCPTSTSTLSKRPEERSCGPVCRSGDYSTGVTTTVVLSSAIAVQVPSSPSGCDTRQRRAHGEALLNPRRRHVRYPPSFRQGRITP